MTAPIASTWNGYGLRLHKGYSPTAALMLVTLSGCASNTPPLANAFCVVYQRLPDPGDAVNMKKRENKLAILANEQSFDRECLLGDRSKSLGPR